MNEMNVNFKSGTQMHVKACRVCCLYPHPLIPMEPVRTGFTAVAITS